MKCSQLELTRKFELETPMTRIACQWAFKNVALTWNSAACSAGSTSLLVITSTHCHPGRAIWKPDPLDENPIFVYTLIYSVYTETRIYENLTSYTHTSESWSRNTRVLVWAKAMPPNLGTVYDFFYDVWIRAQATPMTVHGMVQSKMKKQCEEKEFR